VLRDQCNTEYEQKCITEYREEVEYYTETECNTDYKQDCEYQWEGTGNNKVWAPIPGSCTNNAYDNCGDVQKQKLKQVPYESCASVPKKVCNKVPENQCRQVQQQDCNQVPYQDCQDIPQEQCNPVHKKISRTVPKKVCDGTGGSVSDFGGGFNFGSSNTNLIRKEEEEDFEVFSEKQINTKSGDAVNFGK